MFDRPIRFIAQLAPFEIAASSPAADVDFQRLDADVDRLARALNDEGVRPGQLVGVCVRDVYLHLLLTVACARLRAPTVSLIPQMAAGMVALTQPATVIVDDASLDTGTPDRRIVADAAWSKAALSQVAPRPWVSTPFDPASLGRIQLSSGTTGEPKAVGLSWTLLSSRLDHGGGGRSRLLSLVGPESGALLAYLSCWAGGGTVLFGPDNPDALVRALPRLAPTLMIASPVQLVAVLDALPKGMSIFPNLMISIAGARVGRALRERALRLGGSVLIAYASTEAGTIAIGVARNLESEAAVGWPTPWSEVEVVDASGAPVQPGEIGRIRLRGPDVVTDYAGDTALTAERFRDGWFYSGDLGSIGSDGLLSVHGREDELMNFGGQKYLPDTLEAPVRLVPGVLDVAAFGLDDASGVSRPWLAIVRGEGLEERAIGAALNLPDLPAVHIVWIDALPRTALGKVRREALQQAAKPLQEKLAQDALVAERA